MARVIFTRATIRSLIMKYRFFLMVGVLWILVGAFIGAPLLFPNGLKTDSAGAAPRAVDQSQPVVNEVPLIQGKPTHIKFPSVNVSVDVAPGYYNKSTKTWTLSKDKAHFATTTAEPNNKTGNTFIYGHNRWQVFTALLDAKPGDTAIVTTDNGHTFTYILRSIHDTDPTDISYMQPHNSPILTVQTCSGIWYEKRHMLIFDLKEVQ